MDVRNNLPARKLVTTNEAQQPFANLDLRESQHIKENHADDDVEQVSADVPTDVNVGQSKSLKDSIADTLSSKPEPVPVPAKKTYAIIELKRSPSSELLKIENLDDYMQACAAYRQGLSEERSKDYLLKMVQGWQRGSSKG